MQVFGWGSEIGSVDMYLILQYTLMMKVFTRNV